jgi:hypothetical protein
MANESAFSAVNVGRFPSDAMNPIDALRVSEYIFPWWFCHISQRDRPNRRDVVRGELAVRPLLESLEWVRNGEALPSKG